MTQPVVTRFDISLIERLQKLAALTGRTKSYYIKEAVSEKIEDMELAYLAESRAENVRTGKCRVYSLDEVKRLNGIQD